MKKLVVKNNVTKECNKECKKNVKNIRTSASYFFIFIYYIFNELK